MHGRGLRGEIIRPGLTGVDGGGRGAAPRYLVADRLPGCSGAALVAEETYEVIVEVIASPQGSPGSLMRDHPNALDRATAVGNTRPMRLSVFIVVLVAAA
jgi:hypothetical protein